MRVAVVGSGVTGLAATFPLSEYSPHKVHLYETDDRPGGHASTVHVTQPGKEPVDVDTGFFIRILQIVFNTLTYPNFLGFLALHKRSVEVIKSQNTFSVSRDGGAFEWAGYGLRSVFCQPRRVFDLGMWRMLFDILRFNACAVRVLAECDDLSIGEYLQREGYSSRFRDDNLIPMTAAVWSTPPDICAIDFPAKTLIRVMYNHHLLQITGESSWLTIKLKIACCAAAPLNTCACGRFGQGNVMLETAIGKRETFDHIISACHSDDALRILDTGSGATPTERNVLSAFQLMLRSRLAWSSWNYITRTTVDEKGTKKANGRQLSLTYWINDLQRLSSQKHGHFFATLNPLFPPSYTRVLGHYAYSHPVLSADSMRAQRLLAQLNEQAATGVTGPDSGRHRAFAGAWTRYGFYEDGFSSGLRAAAALPGVTHCGCGRGTRGTPRGRDGPVV
ncbi:hypothetical protein F5888DRAFT_1637936 [Russula emetica]|nr:hypothetical protein F5888DRAFT_1637936 [Russula emetica]